MFRLLLNLINTPSVSVIIASVLCRLHSADTFKKNVLQFRLCAPCSSSEARELFSSFSSTSGPKKDTLTRNYPSNLSYHQLAINRWPSSCKTRTGRVTLCRIRMKSQQLRTKNKRAAARRTVNNYYYPRSSWMEFPECWCWLRQMTGVLAN